MLRSLWSGFIFGGIAIWPAAARAADIEVSTVNELRAALTTVAPGDNVVLRGGTYALNGAFTQLARSGSAQQPITIRPKTGEIATITQLDTQNALQISAQYVVVQNLRFVGGAIGIRLQGGADFVTLQGNVIRDMQSSGVTFNLPGETYQGIVVRQNELANLGVESGGVGTGVYAGCANDACRSLGAVIEGNYVHDLNPNANVGVSRAIDVRSGSAANVVRDNVLQGYPDGLVVGDTLGNGSENVIERNALWQQTDFAISVSSNAIVRNNIVLSNGFNALRALAPSTGTLQNLRVVNNSILFGGQDAAVRFPTNTTAPSVVLANNAIYAPGGVALRDAAVGMTVTNNIGTGSVIGSATGFGASGNASADFTSAGSSNGPPADLTPRTGSALIGQASSSYVPVDDFNASSRSGSLDVGAYRRYSGANPGWPLSNGFKLVTPATSMPMPLPRSTSALLALALVLVGASLARAKPTASTLTR